MEIVINRPIAALGVLATLLVCAAGAAEAQVGVTAGVAQSTMAFSSSSESREQTRQRTGLIAGASLLLPTARAGGWQVDALVVEKGAANLLRRDDVVRLTYVEIPIMLHLDVLQRHRNAVFLLAGPSIAFLLRASYEADAMTENIKNDVSNVDVGLHVGAGVELGHVVFDVRYGWGMRTVFHDGDTGGSFKNRALSVMAGIRFGR
jgi:hypothetical protein